MPSGSCARIAELPPPARAIFDDARRGAFGTIAPDGAPRLVPVVFALRGDEIVLEIDDKPKRTRSLARVENIRRDPRVTLLTDRWDEDWTQLGWVMVQGEARIEPPGGAAAQLRERYPQYGSEELDGPVIAITPGLVRWWTFS